MDFASYEINIGNYTSLSDEQLDARLEGLAAQIKELEKRLARARKGHYALREEAARRVSVFKLGQRVMMNGKLFQICRVVPFQFDGIITSMRGSKVTFYGHPILKSGEVGKLERELYGDLELME